MGKLRKDRTEHRGTAGEVEDILAGRAHVNVGELLDLIHHVNPTGRAVPPDVRKERYALKARLQSHLLRHHGDEITVRPDPRQPGFVCLEAPTSGRDGCHALLGTLDDDARSLAQARLDRLELGDTLPPGPRPCGRPRAPAGTAEDAGTALPEGVADADPQVAELLRRGLALQQEYDYAAARSFFERALELSGRGPGPACLLLELLVDHLGADDDALGLLQVLPAEALRHPGVRELLGRAAARQGHEAITRRALRAVAERRSSKGKGRGRHAGAGGKRGS